MVRRHMDKTGTRIGGDKMRAVEERAGFGIEFAVREFVGHRVLGDGSGELGAFYACTNARVSFRAIGIQVFVE